MYSCRFSNDIGYLRQVNYSGKNRPFIFSPRYCKIFLMRTTTRYGEIDLVLCKKLISRSLQVKNVTNFTITGLLNASPGWLATRLARPISNGDQTWILVDFSQDSRSLPVYLWHNLAEAARFGRCPLCDILNSLKSPWLLWILRDNGTFGNPSRTQNCRFTGDTKVA